jgi:hypothetical protein
MESVSDHVRTMADVNGDGRQDIVGFGIHGTWIALSTGVGFGPMQFAIADFGYNQGWRVSKHVRTMADINGDGRQDIVGFGENAVWIALSTGAGFGAAQLALSDFSYNQGWRVDRHPRFVADLNADGYLDIVGYGEKAVYRALGSPGGFVGNRMILRALTAKYTALAPTLTPRLLGDVNGDGMQDLVVYEEEEIRIAWGSDIPPPPTPNTPTNPHITFKNETTITFAWDDNSNDETGFLISWQKAGEGVRYFEVGKNITSKTFNDLDPDTEYCFSVRAFNLFSEGGETRNVCARTDPREEPEPTPQGISRVDVFNCHSEQRPVHIWTRDVTQGFWVERGTAPSLWNKGSCPGSATPFMVPLEDGRSFWFVAVDPQQIGCGGQNNPIDSACQRSWFTNPLPGKATGPVLNHQVN